MNIASIDIGTNTVLLLIAQIDTSTNTISQVLNNEYRMPRIGKALKPGEHISEMKVQELLTILDEYFMLIKEANCNKVLINATNAFRIASNGESLAKSITEKYGFKVNIVSGNDEAHLSFLGGYSATPDSGNKIIIDIGGGSTEIICGNMNNILFSESFPFGVVSLTEKYATGNPMLPENIISIAGHVKKTIAKISNLPYNQIISVAGTPTTFATIVQNSTVYKEDLVEGYFLAKSGIMKLNNEFKKYNSKELLNEYGTILTGREDVILTGGVILKSILETLNSEGTYVSAKGVRFGAIVKYIQQLN